MTVRRLLFWALVLLAAALAPAAEAQIYPTRPVRIVVGFPPGSASDIMARVYADKLCEYFNQRFTIENMTGDSSDAAAALVARSAPDGYTLLLASNTLSANVALASRPRYAFPSDFDSIALLGTAPTVLVVSRKLGAHSVPDLIRLAKARPGGIHYGSAGAGTGPQISAELFNATAGTSLAPQLYAGTHDAVADLVAGRLPVLFAPLPAVAEFAADRRIEPLAVVATRRSPLTPGLPTLAEAGGPAFDIPSWYGLMAPRGLPAEIRRELAFAVTYATRGREFKRFLAASGAEPVDATLDAFAGFLDLDVARWGGIVAKARAGAGASGSAM